MNIIVQLLFLSLKTHTFKNFTRNLPFPFWNKLNKLYTAKFPQLPKNFARTYGVNIICDARQFIVSSLTPSDPYLRKRLIIKILNYKVRVRYNELPHPLDPP